MTASAIITEKSATVTVEVNGEKVTLPLTEVTDLITQLFAARKSGYEALRASKAAATAAAKAEREAKKAERKAAADAKKEARVAKLQEQLTKLTA